MYGEYFSMIELGRIKMRMKNLIFFVLFHCSYVLCIDNYNFVKQLDIKVNDLIIYNIFCFESFDNNSSISPINNFKNRFIVKEINTRFIHIYSLDYNEDLYYKVNNGGFYLINQPPTIYDPNKLPLNSNEILQYYSLSYYQHLSIPFFNEKTSMY